MTYELDLRGLVPSKKNEKVPVTTKSGKRRMYYQAQPEIDRLSMQVPGELRDLGLVHPDIDIYMTKTDGRSDKDGALSTLLDIMVKMGILKNDSVAQCNGRITLHPVRRGGENRTMILLNDTRFNLWPK